jgi:hypothetical protein
MAELPDGQVTIERQGGFAGLAARAQLEYRALGADQRAALAALFAAPKAGPSKGADRFTYVVSYVHNGKTHTITVPEDRMPAELSSLVVDQLPRR